MSLGIPREVGRLNNTLTVRRSCRLKLTNRQQEIIVGSILGDAYIYPQGKIQFEHSAKQISYIKWKFAELKSLAYSQPKLIRRKHKLTGKTYSSYRFWLRQYFRPWRKIFYPKGHKIFPDYLKLTPLMIAVWYMDDGSFSDHVCTISTESFSTASIFILRKKLRQQYQLPTEVRSNGKIWIRSKDHKKFALLIKKHLHKSMLYKLP